PIVQKSIEVNYVLEFDYTMMNEIMMIVKQYNCSVIDQQTQLFCLLKIGIPKQRLTEVLYKLKDLHTVSVQKL
ncbi:hypothetical protein ABTN40_20080, partial [Acinetobacter baumannii]